MIKETGKQPTSAVLFANVALKEQKMNGRSGESMAQPINIASEASRF